MGAGVGVGDGGGVVVAITGELGWIGLVQAPATDSGGHVRVG